MFSTFSTILLLLASLVLTFSLAGFQQLRTVLLGALQRSRSSVRPSGVRRTIVIREHLNEPIRSSFDASGDLYVPFLIHLPSKTELGEIPMVLFPQRLPIGPLPMHVCLYRCTLGLRVCRN